MLRKSCNGLWPKAIKNKSRFTDGMRKQIRKSFTIYIIRFHLDMLICVKTMVRGHLIFLKLTDRIYFPDQVVEFEHPPASSPRHCPPPPPQLPLCQEVFVFLFFFFYCKPHPSASNFGTHLSIYMSKVSLWEIKAQWGLLKSPSEVSIQVTVHCFLNALWYFPGDKPTKETAGCTMKYRALHYSFTGCGSLSVRLDMIRARTPKEFEAIQSGPLSIVYY